MLGCSQKCPSLMALAGSSPAGTTNNGPQSHRTTQLLVKWLLQGLTEPVLHSGKPQNNNLLLWKAFCKCITPSLYNFTSAERAPNENSPHATLSYLLIFPQALHFPPPASSAAAWSPPTFPLRSQLSGNVALFALYIPVFLLPVSASETHSPPEWS